VLCAFVPCRRRTVVATHRILFDQGALPLYCRRCAEEWNLKAVASWPLNSDNERDFVIVVQKLRELYSETDALTWLRSPHQQLRGAYPIHMLGTRRTAEVMAIIEGLTSGAYA